MSLGRLRISPIGLDAGARTLRAVQVDRCGPLPRITAAACFPRVEPGGLPGRRDVERLGEVLDRCGFIGRRVVVGLPDEKLLSTAFELAAAAVGAPAETISRVELARAAGCNPQGLEVASWRLPKPARAKDASHIVALGCLHADANAYLDAVESAGLEAEALEPRPMALARACAPLMATQRGIGAIVDLDWGATTTTVMYEGAIIYQRSTTEVGGGPLLRALAQDLSLPEDLARHVLLRATRGSAGENGAAPPPGALPDKAQAVLGEHVGLLVEEVSLAISYASHRYPEPAIDLVLLTGEAARIPGLPGQLADRLRTSVRAACPSEGAGCEPGLERTCGSPALTAALGLALWQGARA